jgi:hypothetical protein
MPHLEDFCRTGYSFEERTGDADPVSAAIGRITLWFSQLEDNLSTAVHRLLKLDLEMGEIVTSELSFKAKVHLMASLARKHIPTRRFNTGDIDAEELLDELVARCFKAEELRNQVLHSSWIGPFLSDGKVFRRKVTAKASRGLHVHQEEMDAGYLLDVADFICCVGDYVNEYFYEPSEEVSLKVTL